MKLPVAKKHSWDEHGYLGKLLRYDKDDRIKTAFYWRDISEA